MSNIGGDGGGMFGSSKGPTTTEKSYSGGYQATTTEVMTPEQKKWFNKALSLYGPTLGQGTETYSGETIAGFSDLQKDILGQTPKWAENITDTETPLFEESGDAIKKVLAGELGAEYITPAAMEQYYQTNIKKPAMKTYQEETLPGIQEQYAGPGYWSSARAGATTKASSELQDWLGEQRGELAWETLQENRATEEAKAARALLAAPLGVAYSEQPLTQETARQTALQNIFGFAEEERGMEQAKINEAIEKFAKENQITDPENLTILMSLLGMPVTTSSLTSGENIGKTYGYTTNPSWHTGDWMQFIVQAIASLYGGGG